MKVAFNGKFLTASPTGVHRVACELISSVDHILGAKTADRDRYACEVLAPPNARSDWPLHRIPIRRLGPFTWQPWEQFELPVLARNKLLVNLCNLAPLSVVGAITMIHDAQVFISPESYSPQFRAWYQFALPKIGRLSSRILTVSDYSRRMLASYGVAPIEKISVIHNGVEHITRTPADPAVVARLGLERGCYVIALANTQKHKNVGLLLQVMARPEMAGVKLVLTGAAGAEKFQAAGMPAPPNVVFAGRVSDGEMRALMEAAACLAFPSTTEGFGLPPLEAMAVGCPVVLAPCGALPEVYQDMAVYAGPNDPAAWALALSAYVDDKTTRQTAGTASRAYAAKFTWDRAARSMMDVFDEVAG